MKNQQRIEITAISWLIRFLGFYKDKYQMELQPREIDLLRTQLLKVTAVYHTYNLINVTDKERRTIAKMIYQIDKKITDMKIPVSEEIFSLLVVFFAEELETSYEIIPVKEHYKFLRELAQQTIPYKESAARSDEAIYKTFEDANCILDALLFR